jgi:competence ComEA-like helix-hairpin-helix protein
VDLYTRRQLTLLLVVVLVAAAGIGIDRWRRAHPELADRLEALDRAPAASTPTGRASRVQPDRAGPAVPRTPPPTGGRAPVDLNRATSEELQRLPGIGPGLAARIVDARRRRGSFGSVDELRRVRGIGDTTLARVRPLLAVGPAP